MDTTFFADRSELVAKMLANVQGKRLRLPQALALAALTKCPRLPELKMRNFQKLVKYRAKFSKGEYHNKMPQRF
jgi:hypothetical protein